MTLFPVVILAGGLATRLRPLTETLPKALLDVNGQPFVTHQINLLYQQGVREVVMCIAHMGAMLEEFLGDGSQFGVKIQYCYDGEKLLGTGGAIKKALPLLADNFFVLYGDSYLPCDFLAVQQSFILQNKPGLMTVFYNQSRWDNSNVEFNHGHIRVYDKKNRTEVMQHIDYGLGVFNKTAFEIMPGDTEYDLAELYQNLLKENQLAAYEVKERFYEVGSFAGIEELGYYLSKLPTG